MRGEKKIDSSVFYFPFLWFVKKSLMRAVSLVVLHVSWPTVKFRAHLSFWSLLPRWRFQTFRLPFHTHTVQTWRTWECSDSLSLSLCVCVGAKKKTTTPKSWPDLSWQTWRLKLYSHFMCVCVSTRQHSWDSDPIHVDPTPSSAGCVGYTYVLRQTAILMACQPKLTNQLRMIRYLRTIQVDTKNY